MRVVLEKTWEIIVAIFEGLTEVLSGIFYFMVGALILIGVVSGVIWLYGTVDSNVFASVMVGLSIIAHALIIAESK